MPRGLGTHKTRKSRGSLGRSLNPLGTLAHPVSGRGPDSAWSSLPMAEAAGRCAIRRSRPPRLRKDLASRETRRSVTARRSRRIPVRSPDRPWLPRFPGGSRFPHHGLGAALTSPNLLIRAAAGFPRRRGWKRRPAPRCWQLNTLILFREVIDSFRGAVGAGEGCPYRGRFSLTLDTPSRMICSPSRWAET
jgi:hypothetical protein